MERHRKEARKILDKSFEPERLGKVIDAKYKSIEDELKTDPFPYTRATVPGDRNYDGIVDSMRAFVRGRYASAVEQFDKSGERPKVGRTPQSRANAPKSGERPKVERPPRLPPQLAGKIQRIE